MPEPATPATPSSVHELASALRSRLRPRRRGRRSPPEPARLAPLPRPWGASLEELRAQYPGLARTSSRRYMYRGPVVLGDLSFDDRYIVLIFDTAGGLVELDISVPNKNSLEVVQMIQQEVGGGRTASYPVGKVFQHLFEWVQPDYAIEFKYMASTAEPFVAPHATDLRALLEISRDPPKASAVDAAKTYPEKLEEMRRLMEGQRKKDDERNDE